MVLISLYAIILKNRIADDLKQSSKCSDLQHWRPTHRITSGGRFNRASSTGSFRRGVVHTARTLHTVEYTRKVLILHAEATEQHVFRHHQRLHDACANNTKRGDTRQHRRAPEANLSEHTSQRSERLRISNVILCCQHNVLWHRHAAVHLQ